VILFSPGSGTIPAFYASLCEDLASHGYVVAAVDHPYDDLAVTLADGRLVKQAKQPSGGEELLRFERERVAVRTQDLRFALDQLARVADGRTPDALQGRLDLSHTGAFGHSVGGMTAAELCKQDSRVLACANMDGLVYAMPAYIDDPAQGIERPFLFLEKPLPAMKGEKPEDTQRRLAFLRGKGNALLAGVRSGASYRVTITGATHATFSDEELLASDTGKRQTELLALVRGYLRAFFDKSIRSQTNTLLDAPPSDDAVRIQVFTPK
jgi:dienelactone hydrolase